MAVDGAVSGCMRAPLAAIGAQLAGTVTGVPPASPRAAMRGGRPATDMAGTAPPPAAIAPPGITTAGQRLGQTITGLPAAATMAGPMEEAGNGVHSPAVVNGYYGGVGCWAC